MHTDPRVAAIPLLAIALAYATAVNAATGDAAAVDAAATQGSAAPNVSACMKLGLERCPEPLDAQLPLAADMLTWDPKTRIVGFRNTWRLYEGDVFHARGLAPHPLPAANHALPPIKYRLDGHDYTLADYLDRESVTGMLVLKDGRIAYEYYGAGNTPTTLWTSRSVAKSVVSVLVGVAIREGSIGAVTDPVVRYLPELKGTAWEGTTLRNLLQHTSGVAWNEDYADAQSDFAKLTRCEAGPSPLGCVMALAKSLPRRPGVQPGDAWSYNTMGAWLVGRLLEKATGMTLARYLETRIWSRYAMENDGVWQALVPGEVDMGGHGFNATLRDWGRFAQFVADGGRLPDGTALLPEGWIRDSTTWTRAHGSVTPATPDGQYGYQWWYMAVEPGQADTDDATLTSRESFWAEGIFGQVIAIDAKEHLEMVQWSAYPSAAKPTSLYDEQVLLFNALARSLRERAP